MLTSALERGVTTQHTEAARQPLTTLSEDERLFRDSVYEFANREVRPLVREMDEHAKVAPGLIEKLFDLGVMGIEIPDAYGGGGASFFHSVLAVEALSRVDPSIGVLVDVQNTLVINALLRWGSDEVKRRYLPKMAATTVGAYALSEAGSGSDAFAMATRAQERDGEWVITGRKLWITNGNEAGLFIVFANMNPEAGYRGITAFLVERGVEGFTVGKKEDKLGIRASSTCELLFDECRVPRVNVLGEVGKGYKVAIETLNEGRIGIGAQMIGLAQGALDHTIAYTRERKQFGKAIAEFQAVQHQIARAALGAPIDALVPGAPGFYRPAVAFTFAIDYLLHDVRPRGYGFTNLALYLLCIGAISRLSRAVGLSAAAATLAAVLWAVNPHGINMAVVWLSGRTSLCLTLFAVLAASAIVRRRYVSTSVFLAAALASKEEAIALPVILFAWHRLVARDDTGDGVARRDAWRAAAALAAPLGIYAAVRLQTAAFMPWSAP